MSSIKGSFQSLRQVSRGELFVIMVYDETIFVLKIALFARIRLIDKKENQKIQSYKIALSSGDNHRWSQYSALQWRSWYNEMCREITIEYMWKFHNYDIKLSSY